MPGDRVVGNRLRSVGLLYIDTMYFFPAPVRGPSTEIDPLVGTQCVKGSQSVSQSVLQAPQICRAASSRA